MSHLAKDMTPQVTWKDITPGGTIFEGGTSQVVETIHSVLEKTPPELAADIADRGIVLTGGGSLLRGLEELISARTGINTMTAEDPMTAVAVGTGKYVEFLSGYGR